MEVMMMKNDDDGDGDDVQLDDGDDGVDFPLRECNILKTVHFQIHALHHISMSKFQF
jgi:hypothetical protein